MITLGVISKLMLLHLVKYLHRGYTIPELVAMTNTEENSCSYLKAQVLQPG